MPSEPLLITLTTDFGLTDEYVGVMKGVILSRAPHAVVVDLCHHVPAQDIRHAALLLAASYRYFPATALHVAVVDPGVGTDRRLILLCTEHGRFLAPDNGLLTPVLQQTTTHTAYAVTNQALFLKERSSSFHGRDIVAPVAAALVAGLSPAKVGPVLDPGDLVRIALPTAEIDERTRAIHGEVMLIDHFGNLITNITAAQVTALASQADRLSVAVANHAIGPLQRAYGDAPPGSLLALIGSRRVLEITVNSGNAALLLQTPPGTPVTVSLRAE